MVPIARFRFGGSKRDLIYTLIQRLKTPPSYLLLPSLFIRKRVLTTARTRLFDQLKFPKDIRMLSKNFST